MQQTTIRGQVNTVEGTVPPDAKVIVLKYKKNEPACESCETKVNRDGRYTIESSLPPGPYTLMAYDGKQYSKDEENRELKRGLNDKVDFILGSPTARVVVRGTATDPQGAVIPSATVILYASGCRVCEIDRVTGDQEGKYVFKGLASPENYLVAVTAPGFMTAYQTLEISDQQEQQIASVLQPAGAKEDVTFTADAPIICDIREIQIDLMRLPLGASSVVALLSLQPGLSTASINGLSTTSINGSSSTFNRFTIDGSDTTDTLVSSARSPVSLSAARELRFFQPGYENPQLNNSSGGNIDVSIRSGSASFHGGVDYQVRNEALDARSFFSLPEFDTFRSHMGSAALSGPILKDQLFFSFNYELDRRAKSPTFSTIVASQIDTLNQQLRRLGLPAEDLRRFVTTSASDSPLLRLDFNVSNNRSLSVIYSFRRDLIGKDLSNALNGTSPTPSTARDLSGRNHLLSFRYTWIASPNLASETSYSYKSNSISILPSTGTNLRS
jgi:hypothetical protein